MAVNIRLNWLPEYRFAAPMARIIEFYRPKDDYGFMSNFYPSAITIDGINYPTVEHYFQAQKFLGPNSTPASQEYATLIAQAKNPLYAYKLGKQDLSRVISDITRYILQSKELGLQPRPDWEEVKDQIMYRGLQAKFAIPEFAGLLAGTGKAQLIEAAPYDKYWGVGRDGQGRNQLGKLLMHIRAQLPPQIMAIESKITADKTPQTYSDDDLGCLRGFPPPPCPPQPFNGQYPFKEDYPTQLCSNCQRLNNARVLICDPQRDMHVICYPNFLSNEQANFLWQTILAEIPMHVYQGENTRSGGTFDYPRFMAFMSDRTDKGRDMVAYGDRSDWHPVLEQLRQHLQAMVGDAMHIDSALINYYRFPENKISLHADREVRPPRNVVLAVSLSPYYSRRIIFKEMPNHATGPGGKPRKWTFYPPHGSLYIMEGQVNKLLKHESPPLTKTEIKKFGYDPLFMQRISITMRNLKY